MGGVPTSAVAACLQALLLQAGVLLVQFAGGAFGPQMSPRPHWQPPGSCGPPGINHGSEAAFAVCLGGFNKLDATGANDQAALQAAFDSGAEVAVVSFIGRPWLINSSLILRSHQTVWMEPGVEIQARPGGFHCNQTSLGAAPLPPPKECRLPHHCKCHGNLSLLSAQSVQNASIVGYGATLRMHGTDYNNETTYYHSEFRPAMVLSGVTAFSVLGLTIVSTGGDGITLMGNGSVPSSRVTFKDLDVRQAYRNGLSVISAEHLVVEDSSFSETCTTAANYGGPCCGIDFEPDYHSETLTNLTFRRVKLRDNKQCGAVVSPAGLCGSGAACTQGKSISIKFEDCEIEGGRAFSSAGLVLNGIPPKITGIVQADRLRVSGVPGPGVLLANKAATGATFICSECVFSNTAWMRPLGGYSGTNLPTAVLMGGAISHKSKDNGFAFGGVRLDNCSVVTSALSLGNPEHVLSSPPLLIMDGGGRAVESVSGSLEVASCRSGQCCAVNATGVDVARQLAVRCERQDGPHRLKSDDYRVSTPGIRLL